jgi:AraC family transcriptional regulator of adaptative response/methylated-DNA-[protein]-cysteine methyltransferase
MAANSKARRGVSRRRDAARIRARPTKDKHTMNTATMPDTTRGYVTDAQRWAATTRREPDADGVFYYAVRTTGVFCRPSCGARRALRSNVRFFDTAAAAERAGFRACKRCRPNGEGLAREHAALVARACRLIDGADTMPA